MISTDAKKSLISTAPEGKLLKVAEAMNQYLI